MSINPETGCALTKSVSLIKFQIFSISEYETKAIWLHQPKMGFIDKIFNTPAANKLDLVGFHSYIENFKNLKWKKPYYTITYKENTLIFFL